MKFTKFLITMVLVFLICGMAIADKPRNLVRRDRPDTEFDLSALPNEIRSNEHVYFVDSTATEAADQTDGIHGKSWLRPYATVDWAIDRMAAGGGTILVAPGHTESVISAGDWAMDIAGVTIEGKGHGDNRPVITTTTAAAASILVTADDCVIRGLNIRCGILANTHAIDVAADDLWIDNCTFSEGYLADAWDVNGLTYITADGVDSDSDGLHISNCEFTAFDSTSWTSAIEIAQDFNDVLIENCSIYGSFSDSGIEIPAGGNAQVNLQIDSCYIVNTEAGDHAIQVNGAGNYGVIRNCTLGADTAGSILDAGGLFVANTELVDYDADLDTGAPQLYQELVISKAAVSLISGSVADVFTVAGAPVLVTSLAAVLTEAASNNSVTMAYTADPTTGAGDLAIASGVDIDNTAVGGWIYAEGDGSAAEISAIAGNIAQGATVPFVLPIGGLDIDMGSSNLTTGIVTVYMTFKPMSASSVVTAP